jgi:hypothetical protein
MGRAYVRALSDCRDHGLVLEMVGQRCRRLAYRCAHDLIGRKAGGEQLYGRTSLDALPAVLRRRGQQRVVRRGAKCAQDRALWSHELPRVPAGVHVTEFLDAGDRERGEPARASH